MNITSILFSVILVALTYTYCLKIEKTQPTKSTRKNIQDNDL